MDGTVQESVRGRLLYSVCFGRCRSNSPDELFGILGGLHLVSFLWTLCLSCDWNNNFVYDIFRLKIMEINDPLKDMSPGDRLSDAFADYSIVLVLIGVILAIIAKAASTGSILFTVIIGAIFGIPLLLLILAIIHSRSRSDGNIR